MAGSTANQQQSNSAKDEQPGAIPAVAVFGGVLAYGPLRSIGFSTWKSVSAMIAEPLEVGWMPSP